MAILVQMNIVAGVKIHIDKTCFTLGRGDENDLCIDDDLASRRHAVIEYSEGSSADTGFWLLRDLDSTNGTHVRDQRINVHTLMDGDVFRIGKIFLRFFSDNHAALGETRVIRKTFIPGFYYVTDKHS